MLFFIYSHYKYQEKNFLVIINNLFVLMTHFAKKEKSL